MRYRCHQCFGIVQVEDIAHLDLYADLCWIQCETCAAAFGPSCGTDRNVNPNRHGYLTCPYRVREYVRVRKPLHAVVHREHH